MKRAHSVKVTVFCKEGEDEQAIALRLRALVPFNLEDEKLNMTRTKATSFGDAIIIILEINLLKERHIEAFLEHLRTLLNDQQRQLLVSQKESRLDDELHFFIRLDKEKWMNGEVWITDCGLCFHINIGISAFPAKRENGLSMVEMIFS